MIGETRSGGPLLRSQVKTIGAVSPLWLMASSNDRFMAKWLPRLSGTLVDLGCGRKPYAPWMPQAVTRYIGIDLPRGTGASKQERHADIYADLHGPIPLGDATADVVLLLEVLEHMPDPARLAAEITRVLRPGGLALIATPFVWYLHEIPHDYYRYTPFAFAHLAAKAGFEVVETRPKSGFFGTVTQILVNSLSQVLYRLGGRPLMWLGAPLYWLSNRTTHVVDRLSGYGGLPLGFTTVWRKL